MESRVVEIDQPSIRIQVLRVAFKLCLLFRVKKYLRNIYILTSLVTYWEKLEILHSKELFAEMGKRSTT